LIIELLVKSLSVGSNPTLPNKTGGGRVESKNNFGEMLLSLEEKRKYMELCVAMEISNNYQNIAHHFMHEAVKLKSLFWDFVRQGHNLPSKPFTMTITEDMQRLVIKPAVIEDVNLPRVPRGEDEKIGRVVKAKRVVGR